jgi:tetratricopeptide (TPR) repeat protein
MKTPFKTLTAFCSLLLGLSASAQTLQDAIRLTDNEQYEKARSAFKTLVAKEPTNGDNFFYFGDLLLKMDNPDSARIIFQKGLDINPTNPLTHIGMARYFMATGDKVKGNQELTYATSLISTQANKKDMNMDEKRQAIMYIEIAEDFLVGSSPDFDAAITNANMAVKHDPKNPDAFLILGDAYYGKDPVNGTPALNAYNAAAKLDPKSNKADVRIGRLYINGKNPQVAIGFFNHALKIDSTFAPAWREKGEAQYQLQKFDSAQKSLAKYLTLNDGPLARYRYCLFLYKSGNYDEAIKQGQVSLAKDPSTIVIYRIMARAYLESKTASDPAKSIETWNTFFEKQKQMGAPPLFADDFVYRARAYSKNKQDSLAVLDFEKAMTMDTSRKDLYFEVATSYYIMKHYDKAAEYYKKKIDAAPDKANISDWVAYGRALQAQKDYKNADEAYKKAVASDPANPAGWLYRGKVNALIDTKFESDSTKIFYEKFYSLAIGDKEKNKRDLVTAARYLGGYYFIKKNFTCSKAWFNFVLELDPTQTKVKEQLDTDKDLKAAATVDLSTCAPPPAPAPAPENK